MIGIAVQQTGMTSSNDNRLTAQKIRSRANDAQWRMSGVSGKVADGRLAMSGIAVQQTGITSSNAT